MHAPNVVAVVLSVLLVACQGREPVDDTADTGSDTGVEDTAVVEGPDGFVGSACEIDADCTYEGAVCLDDGLGRGMCSASCDLYCPDRDGHPVTFCVTDRELDGEAAALGDGACHARCDFGVFPQTGCRTGYGCVEATRANEPGTRTYVCMPDREPDLSQCYYDLAARGVGFEPTLMTDEHPEGQPDLTCRVRDPLFVKSPVHGVDLKYHDGSITSRVRASCEMAHALVDSVDDVKEHGVTALYHIGTYNCRTIAGTSTLSQHAFADALDVYGFEFGDGTLWTMIDDWEHTDDPQTEAGTFLYNTAWRWYDGDFWNIILTPNYNSAHENHYHVDLTPGADYIGVTDGHFGPMTHDCGGPAPRARWRLEPVGDHVPGR